MWEDAESHNVDPARLKRAHNCFFQAFQETD
jgi:hypothetical protein